MRFSSALSALSLLAGVRSPGLFRAAAQVAPLCETLYPERYDSGEATSASTVVSHAGAPWIQIDLSGSSISPGAKLVLSTGDAGGSSQEMDPDSLASSNGYSAVFDGGFVSLVLVSAPGAPPSRVVVSGYKVGECGPKDLSLQGNITSLCGADDRVQFNDVRQGRIGGCTGWMISEDVFIQAGHCGTPGGSTRMHFTYGISSAPTADQYAVAANSYKGTDGGVGNDWGAGRMLPNSSTGKLPGNAQTEKCGTDHCPEGKGWYTLGNVPSGTSGNNIRITGYGTAVVDTRSQKTHMDALTQINPTSLRYIPDTTGGNSGSPVVHEETGHAIGVHTHAGCESGGNQGTRIDRSDFAAHVAFLLQTCASDADCDDGVCENGEETCVSGKCYLGTPDPCTGPCNGKIVRVEVLTDNYPTETTWTLTDTCSGTQLTSQGPYSSSNTQQTAYEYCETDPSTYSFTINDSYGDGICCSYGNGGYTIKYDGTQVASGGSFTSSETKTFGTCGPAPPTTPNPVAPPTPNPTNNPVPPPTNNPTNNPVTPNPTSSPTQCTPAMCDDGNACTTDSCNPLGGCDNVPDVPNCCGNEICESGAGEDMTTCPADCAPDEYLTTMAQGNGSSGNTFEIVAKKNLQIMGFRVHNSGTGTIDVKIWHRAGTYQNFQNSNVGWTQVLNAEGVQSAGSGQETVLPFLDSPVAVAAEAKHSFHIVTGSGHRYTSGTAEFSLHGGNDDLDFYEGKGCSGEFSCNFQPRVFNGVILYAESGAPAPTPLPTPLPVTPNPTNNPVTPNPTNNPVTPNPTPNPTNNPVTPNPTNNPVTPNPTPNPTNNPVTPNPTNNPVTPNPTPNPTNNPVTPAPTPSPTNNPVTPNPTPNPTNNPVTPNPTLNPTNNPVTPAPTPNPTNNPVTPAPTPSPTNNPVTPNPTPSPTSGTKPCSGSLVKIDVLTDAHPEDTSWTLKNLCDHALGDHAALRSGQFTAENAQKEVLMCLPPAQYEFVILDSASDGNCCAEGNGHYRVEYEGIQVASGGDFGYAEKTHFGSCPGN